jgi:hypothetical protein
LAESPFVGQTKVGGIVMAGRPMTDNLEGPKDGVLRFVLAVGIVTACLIALFLFIGFGGFGFDKSVAPTQSPAPSGSTNP